MTTTLLRVTGREANSKMDSRAPIREKGVSCRTEGNWNILPSQTQELSLQSMLLNNRARTHNWVIWEELRRGARVSMTKHTV